GINVRGLPSPHGDRGGSGDDPLPGERTVAAACAGGRTCHAEPGLRAPVRFAIVGCGRIAGNHLEAVRGLPSARPVGVCALFPVYQNRYNRAVQVVRQALQDGRFGKPVLGTVRVRWCRMQRYYDRDPWRGTWSLDGGALTNQGIHYLDLLLYLLGDVEWVASA